MAPGPPGDPALSLDPRRRPVLGGRGAGGGPLTPRPAPRCPDRGARGRRCRLQVQSRRREALGGAGPTAISRTTTGGRAPPQSDRGQSWSRFGDGSPGAEPPRGAEAAGVRRPPGSGRVLAPGCLAGEELGRGTGKACVRLLACYLSSRCVFVGRVEATGLSAE